MKLTIKTLQQSTFTVVTEPEKTVKDLKEQIEEEQGKSFPSGAQKLIYSGKILADDSKLSEYNIDEKKFIVLMITRPPPAPKAPISEKLPSTSSVKTESTESKSATTDDKSSTKSNTTSSVSATPGATAGATAAAATTNQPTTRSSARLSSSTNPPPPPQQPVATPAAPASTTAPANNDEASILSAMSEPQLATRLAMLMSQPQFRQIQDHIQQSPHLLSQTIESLAASNPEMYNFISDNPDVFVNALNHPPLAGVRSSRHGEHHQASAVAAGGGPGVEQLIGNVSEHDKEAIERLKELGFSEYLAVQAYMACDKDEQLAANLLFQMDQ